MQTAKNTNKNDEKIKRQKWTQDVKQTTEALTMLEVV